MLTDAELALEYALLQKSSFAVKAHEVYPHFKALYTALEILKSL